MIIKQTIGKTVAIFETKTARLSYAGSVEFGEAVRLAKQGLLDEDVGKPFDFVLHTPEYTADPEGEEVLCEEQIATSVRNDVASEPLAVLITDDDLAYGGNCYQFLYSCDQVEVMTDTGNTIAVFNRLAKATIQGGVIAASSLCSDRITMCG